MNLRLIGDLRREAPIQGLNLEPMVIILFVIILDQGAGLLSHTILVGHDDG